MATTENLKRDDGRHTAPLAARPLIWLYIAGAGLALTGVGVAIDAYRYDHGAAAAGLISRSSPGLALALAGSAIAALGLLAALTLLALHDAPSAESVVRRGAGVLVAWIAVTCAGIAAVTYAASSGLTLGGARTTATTASVAHPAATSTRAAPTEVPGLRERTVLSGALTHGGSPLQADFLGAYVIRDGLVSACQIDIPRVDGGRYTVTVMADAEASGCGAPGSRILLWAFADQKFEYSRETLPWPGGGAAATFDASFSSAAPIGAGAPFTSFKGHVVRSDGTRLPGGSVVEAFVGSTRCGRTTVRRDPEAWFTLLVAGPQVPGCAKDGRITFRVDGKGAAETGTNNLDDGSGGLTIELTAN